MAKSKPPLKKKYIETPEKMWEYFEAYKAATKSNPFLQHDFVGKDGDAALRQKERCLSIEGFINWLEDNDVIKNPEHYFSNKENRYSSYVDICARIKRKIRQDQIEGGMAGIYNPSITQRLNGLVEKTEVTNVEQPLFPEK